MAATPLTHATDRDTGTIVPALCGRFVRLDSRDVNLTTPTCPRCAAIVAEREAEPLPAWAKAWEKVWPAR